jgi:hypothetical protein
MSQIIELPEPVYGALQQAAREAGVTPQAWIAARLAEGKHPTDLAEGKNPTETNQGATPAPKTMADLLAGRVGRFHSGGQKKLSEQCGEQFTDYLEAKRRAGTL